MPDPLDQPPEPPICPQCNFPLECPDHIMRVNLREMCNTCGRRNEPAPEKPHTFPNRCRGDMLEWDAEGKCGYCGRGPGDPVARHRRSTNSCWTAGSKPSPPPKNTSQPKLKIPGRKKSQDRATRHNRQHRLRAPRQDQPANTAEDEWNRQTSQCRQSAWATPPPKSLQRNAPPKESPAGSSPGPT